MMPLKEFVKTILFPAGLHNRRVLGGALKGMTFGFDLRHDTQAWRGIYEQALQAWLKRYVHPGDVCLDIGAADGYFTLLMAKLAGPGGAVYPFEPSHLAARIEQNCALNRKYSLAVVDVQKHYVAAESDSGNDTVSVDAFVKERNLSRVNVIKIDIDGEEVNALRGMEHTLARFKPHLFVEVHSRELLAQVTSIAKAHGYTMKFEDAAAHEWRPMEFNAFYYSQSDLDGSASVVA